MNSHTYAHRLKQIAEVLLDKPEFETDGAPRLNWWYFSDKGKFLGAVKALGSGGKEWRKDELTFVPTQIPEISITVYRSVVCRKVQEEKWECEPLLSESEEASVGREA